MENYRGAPGRQCSICSHPEVGAIQRAVGEGVPLLDACSRYGGAIKKSALHRHMQNHTGRQYRTETASRKTGGRADFRGSAAKQRSVKHLYHAALRNATGLLSIA